MQFAQGPEYYILLMALICFSFLLVRIKARSKRCSIYAPNLADELSTAGERHLNQLGSAD